MNIIIFIDKVILLPVLAPNVEYFDASKSSNSEYLGDICHDF
jgi:hypothetical protein